MRVGENAFTAKRAAYGLTLLHDYLNSDFLTEVQKFKLND